MASSMSSSLDIKEQALLAIATNEKLLILAEDVRKHRENTFMGFIAQARGQHTIESVSYHLRLYPLPTWENTRCDGLLVWIPESCTLKEDDLRDHTKLFNWARRSGVKLQYVIYDFKSTWRVANADYWDAGDKAYSFTVRHNVNHSPREYAIVPCPLKRFVTPTTWPIFGVQATDLPIALERLMQLARHGKPYVNPSTGVKFSGWEMRLHENDDPSNLLPKPGDAKARSTAAILKMWDGIHDAYRQCGQSARFVMNDVAPLVCDYLFLFDGKVAYCEDKRGCRVVFQGRTLRLEGFTTHGGYVLRDFVHYFVIGVSDSSVVYIISRADLGEEHEKDLSTDEWFAYRGPKDALGLLDFIRDNFERSQTRVKNLQATLDLLPTLQSKDDEEQLPHFANASRVRERNHYSMLKKHTAWLVPRLNHQFAKVGKMLCFELEMPFSAANKRRSFTQIVVVRHGWDQPEIEDYDHSGELPYPSLAFKDLQERGCLLVRCFATEPDQDNAALTLRNPLVIYKLDTRMPTKESAFMVLASPLPASEELVPGIEDEVSWILAPSEYFGETTKYSSWNFGLGEGEAKRPRGDGNDILAQDGIDLQRHQLRFADLAAHFEMILDAKRDQAQIVTLCGDKKNPKFATRPLRRTVREVMQELWDKQDWIVDRLEDDDGPEDDIPADMGGMTDELEDKADALALE